jgi:hypothetical protein
MPKATVSVLQAAAAGLTVPRGGGVTDHVEADSVCRCAGMWITDTCIWL